jgi:hypothetical protein
MKMLLVPLLFIFSSFALSSTELIRKSSCTPPSADERVLNNEDFSWDNSLEDLKIKASELYISSKRLERRAYINETGQLVIPTKAYRAVQEVPVTEKFIKSVRLHIEEALKRRYVDAIIFSDMGHSHFFIPQKFYDEVLSPIPNDDRNILYQKMLSHEGLKILYHTAEQLKMKDDQGKLLEDRHLQWRFFTRNLVGDNQAEGKLELLHQEDHAYNTARDYDEGYKYWGAGFYLSANTNGCFAFTHKGETYYFDLNLDGIMPASSY